MTNRQRSVLTEGAKRRQAPPRARQGVSAGAAGRAPCVLGGIALALALVVAGALLRPGGDSRLG